MVGGWELGVGVGEFRFWGLGVRVGCWGFRFWGLGVGPGGGALPILSIVTMREQHLKFGTLITGEKSTKSTLFKEN